MIRGTKTPPDAGKPARERLAPVELDDARLDAAQGGAAAAAGTALTCRKRGGT